MARSSTCLVALVVLLCSTQRAHARDDETFQLWTNFITEWRATPRWLATFDLEPKALVVGAGEWVSVELTSSADFSPTHWLDIIGELLTGYTLDTTNPNTIELAPRLGLRVSPLRKQLTIRDTARIEQRNRFYSDGSFDYAFRLRNRVELLLALNRDLPGRPNAVSLLFDWEFFSSIDRAVHERYASRHRLRQGVGYCFSEAWRMDVLYIWQASRNTFLADFETRDHVLDVRVHWSL